MSNVAITGNASGTGVFTVASPNSNVDRVLTLPDESGTVDTLQRSGNVLQVVSVLTTAQGSQALAAAGDHVVTGLTLSITPKGANSKFLVQARNFGESNTSWDNVYNILMDGVRVNIGGSTQSFAGLSMAGQAYGGATNDGSTPEILTLSTLVSTSSVVGTSITFALAITSFLAKTLYLNRCVNAPTTEAEVGSSEIIITEIGA